MTNSNSNTLLSSIICLEKFTYLNRIYILLFSAKARKPGGGREVEQRYLEPCLRVWRGREGQARERWRG